MGGAVRREPPGALESRPAPSRAPGVDAEEPVAAFVELGVRGEGINEMK